MKQLFAEVITIGDELLFGQITDTNTQWISAELSKIGIRVIRKSSVGDDEQEILTILKEAESRADLIVITGGLGPTKDDITKNTLAKYFNSTLVLNEIALQDLTEFFKKRGRDLTEINRQQAFLPDKCTMIRNRMGTAPGMWFYKDNKVFVSMPGVPFEMEEMMRSDLLERIKTHFVTPVIYHKVIRTIGIGESFLAEKIESWEDNLPAHIKLAYLPSIAEVKLRLTAIGDVQEILEKEVGQEVEKLKSIAGNYIYGYDDEEFEKVIGGILIRHNKKVGFAESCTGGFLSYSITKIPGASSYFAGSIVAYENDVKINQLGVKPQTLEEFGAVSEQTVKEMARGVRERLKTDIGIATSGIAGPSGGTPDKPVGTIWIAFDDGVNVLTRKLQISWSREVNIKWTAMAALNLIRTTLDKID